ncbi:hsp70 nucleotide exchange factor fes1 [Onygenales sp. PD_40]|nr:hsp70 nucleotide exchange factor fes1 [Onygenales sp. PD_40]
MDPGMNNLLKWSLENANPSQPTTNNTTTTTPHEPPRSLSPTALQRLLLNTPSDAELMKNSMAAIRSPTLSLSDKLTAFDNLEQLVENLDNANNLGALGLWTPLVEELAAAEEERRMMGAWCIGTAVQNNESAQGMLLKTAPTALATLLELTQSDPAPAVRKKAVYALSSAIRNFQPAMDELVRHLPVAARGGDGERIDAADMERVDGLVGWLRGEGGGN